MCRILGMSPIEVVISYFGSVSKTARALGVTAQAVCFWRDSKRRVPVGKCPDIERLTGRKVVCEQLRPDVDWQYLRNTSTSEAVNA